MKLVVNEESLWTHVSHGFAGIGDSDARERVCGLDEEANKVMIVLKQQIMLVDLCEEEWAWLIYMFPVQISYLWLRTPEWFFVSILPYF